VGFLFAATANPADTVPRLTWADYLDESGRPEEAAYLREVRGAEMIAAAKKQLRQGAAPPQVAGVVLFVAGGGLEAMTAAARDDEPGSRSKDAGK
jgi:uncharacterized protein (TIGR02996 family)